MVKVTNFRSTVNFQKFLKFVLLYYFTFIWCTSKGYLTLFIQQQQALWERKKRLKQWLQWVRINEPWGSFGTEEKIRWKDSKFRVGRDKKGLAKVDIIFQKSSARNKNSLTTIRKKVQKTKYTVLSGVKTVCFYFPLEEDPDSGISSCLMGWSFMLSVNILS